jgi:uncharacterized protein (TIGR02646 family)
MRLITKGPEPAELRRYRAVPGATYDGADFTPVKDAVRAALLRDQGGLCCYCSQRISAEIRPIAPGPDAPREPWMKVEHWLPQECHPREALLWSNLLGACWGSMGKRRSEQHCDTRKAMTEIALDPKNQAHIETLSLRSDGTLRSSNARFQREIDDVLGLNLDALKQERKRALDEMLDLLCAKHPNGIPREAMRRHADAQETPRDGALPPHCGVVRLYLRKRFRGQP